MGGQWQCWRARLPALAAVAMLALLLPPGDCARPDPKDKVAMPDFSIYHTKEATFRVMRELAEAHPNIMRLENFTHANDGYASTLTVIHVDPAGIGKESLDNRMRLLLNFGEHGRELITVEVALKLLRLLADPRELRALPWLAGRPLEPLLQLLHHCVFKIVPMENVHGRALVEGGALCERKNGRGVDPNRNWDLHWGHKEKDYDPNEEYPGKHPFSEPEAVLMRLLAEEFAPHVWLNMHSGMEALFMPYDHQPHLPTGEGAEASLRILEALNELACGKRCAVGSGGKSVGYLAHGTATDYMFEALHVPLSFTWEIYGDVAAMYEDCFRMFNPVEADAVAEVVDRWVSALLMLVELLPSHPAVPDVSFHDHRGLTSTGPDLRGALGGAAPADGGGDADAATGGGGGGGLAEWVRARRDAAAAAGGERKHSWSAVRRRYEVRAL